MKPLLLLISATTAWSYPICDLCFGGGYPNKPYTITAVQYINGNPTCADLYLMGLNGEIDPLLCYPMQLYMQKPCGCFTQDEDNWNETNWGTSTTPSFNWNTSTTPSFSKSTPPSLDTHKPTKQKVPRKGKKTSKNLKDTR